MRAWLKGVRTGAATAGACFLSCAAVGWALLRPPPDLRVWSLMLMLPGLAAMALIASTTFVPGLVKEADRPFPWSLTLPTVFAAWLVAGVQALAASPIAAVRAEGYVRADQVWARPEAVAAAWVASILVSALALRAPTAEQSDADRRRD